MRLLLEHLPLSAVIGLAGWWLSGDSGCLPAALVTGWMVDADHLVDFLYYVARTKGDANYAWAGTGKYFKHNGKVFVPMHAWELTIVLLSCAVVFQNASTIFVCAALAHGVHLIQDQRSYKVRPLGYWLTSRFYQDFKLDGFCATSGG